MTTVRFFKERYSQGEDEAIPYKFLSTPWGTSPTSVSVKVFDVTNAQQTSEWLDVTSIVMPVNSPSVVGNLITLSKLQSLTDAHIYRVEVKFTVSEIGNCEAIGFIFAGE